MLFAEQVPPIATTLCGWSNSFNGFINNAKSHHSIPRTALIEESMKERQRVLKQIERAKKIKRARLYDCSESSSA
jgi:hypothetical protein